MQLPTIDSIVAASDIVRRVVQPTPQLRWPLLCERIGAEVWVKHENHTPLGAFKIRGGLVYMEDLVWREPGVRGVIAATRGNHGQSIAFAASRVGLRAVIVVPHGNSREKNAAMRAHGAELIEHGSDFQEAFEHAGRLAEAQRLHFVPSFHETLVRGVASYALELFLEQRALDALYVPIGLGSGICGAMAVRDGLGLATEIIGVVAAGAPAYARSFAARQPIASGPVNTIADGMAVRVPSPQAVQLILSGVSRIVMVQESEIHAAMRHYFTDTHNIAEGAGAAALAALIQEKDRMQGRRVAVVLTGSNVDREIYAGVLAQGD